ncbi:ParB/RepB/Spo0J family partition protein, partial [Candidatus Bathyarchaeota archaeon]|nr:ParB/RepB/Spo0J family partition protein [Candidatus Bathyarchaeota archaeon]
MSTQVQIRLNPEIAGWRSEKKPDKELMEDIKRNSQVEAITARKMPDGTLEIISGNRRYAAMLEDGISPEDMKINVLEDIKDDDAIVMAIAGNTFRKDFTAIEEARAFNTLREMKWSVKKIAERLNHSESYVKDRLEILDLPKPIQNMVVEGKVE